MPWLGLVSLPLDQPSAIAELLSTCLVIAQALLAHRYASMQDHASSEQALVGDSLANVELTRFYDSFPITTSVRRIDAWDASSQIEGPDFDPWRDAEAVRSALVSFACYWWANT